MRHASSPAAASVTTISNVRSRNWHHRKRCLSAERAITHSPTALQPFVGLSRRGTTERSLAADFQVVEVRHGIGLGPQTDLAGVLEGVVLHIEMKLVVQIALDVVA